MPFNPTDDTGQITTYGLVPYTAEELLIALNAEVLENLKDLTDGDTIDTSDQSVVGRLKRYFCGQIGLCLV